MKRLNFWFNFTIRLLKGDDHAKFRLAEKIFNKIYPNYFIGEWGKIYLENKVFYKYYCKYDNLNFRSYERKYFLQQLIKLTKNIKGDTVELGVYFGASSELILQAIKHTEKKHFMFDSWQGVSEPNLEDGTYWEKGALNSSLVDCKNNLSAFKEDKKALFCLSFNHFLFLTHLSIASNNSFLDSLIIIPLTLCLIKNLEDSTLFVDMTISPQARASGTTKPHPE